MRTNKKSAVQEYKARTLALLALACLLMTVPATAQVNYAVSNNTAYVANSFPASGDIVIASTYLGYPVTYIEQYAFIGCSGLTSVIIPNSVTGMGDRVFESCPSLRSVTIGNGVTSIGFRAFLGCSSLASVTIPDSVISLGTNPTNSGYIGGVFSGCTSLTNVIIGNSVSRMENYAFSSCTMLTSVNIPSSVTSIGIEAFNGCASLTNLSVEAANPTYSSLDGVLFDKAQTTLIVFPAGRGGSYVIPNSVSRIVARAFYRSTGLTNAIIGNSVTSIGNYAFDGCTNLASVIIGNGVTTIENNAFSGTRLTSVSIPNSVTSIGGAAFYFCRSLTNVILGHSVASIGGSALSGCTRLTSVTIPSSVTSLGDAAFAGCTNLTNFTFSGNAPSLLPDWHVGGFTQFSRVGAGAKVYYFCGTTGWGTNYGGLPTVMLCAPQIGPGSTGVKPGGFGFTLTRLTNQTIVVEASANLVDWQPIWTNSVPGDSADFIDLEWLQHSNRFYRARSN